MKKLIISLFLVPLSGLVLFGVETASASAAEFGFDFVGTLTDVSSATRNLDFELSRTNRTDVPVWGRKIAVAVASNGVFGVRLADDSGQPLVSQITNLASAVERIGNESLLLTVRDGSKSFAVTLPPSEIAGIAERALGASGDFNAAHGLVVADLTTSDISAGSVQADRISSQTAVKAAGALTVNGDLQVKGALESAGPVAVKQMTVSDSVDVTSSLETKANLKTFVSVLGVKVPVDTKGDLSATSLKGIKTLSVSKTLTVGGVNTAVPEGTIVAWNDTANIPEGWAVCNGENGTPNMRNRFVVGASESYVPGDAEKGYGGADYVQLTFSQMPMHRHRLPYYQGKSKCPYLKTKEVRGVSTKYDWRDTRWTDSACGPESGTSSLGDAHENRPPYYALVFIMKKYGGAK